LLINDDFFFSGKVFNRATPLTIAGNAEDRPVLNYWLIDRADRIGLVFAIWLTSYRLLIWWLIKFPAG
jgi:hypothetical protein